MAGRYKKGEWSGSYQKIMILAESGMKHCDIAKKIGINKSSISRILHSERFIKRRDVYKVKAEEEIYQKFAAVSGDAADKIIHVMKKGSSKDRIRLDAAKDILNYAGHKPKEQVEHVTNNYTIEDANSAKQVIEEIRTLQDKLAEKHSKFLISEQPGEADIETTKQPEDTEAVDITPIEPITGESIARTIPSSPSR